MRWDLEAQYLAAGLTSLISVFAPNLVILGGGVVEHGGLIDEVALRTGHLMNNYMEMPQIIRATADNAVLGAIKLASFN